MRKRAAREAQQKLVAAYALSRLEVETDEDRARALVDAHASAAGFELAFVFFHTLVSPKARMMIPRPLFDDLKQRTTDDAQRASARQLELQNEQRSLGQQNLNLQEQLRALRREYRALGQAVDLHCRKEQSAVLATLQEVVRSLDASISSHRAECAESPHLLNKALEESRLAHREYVQKALEVAASITETYGRTTFSHTKIPLRIRDRLRNSSVEDLMLLLDTLSFEDGALQLLLHKYPPARDDPLAGLGEENPFA